MSEKKLSFDECLIIGGLTKVDPDSDVTKAWVKDQSFESMALTAQRAVEAYKQDSLSRLALDQLKMPVSAIDLAHYGRAATHAEALLASALEQSNLASSAVDQLSRLDWGQYDEEGEDRRHVVIEARQVLQVDNFNGK